MTSWKPELPLGAIGFNYGDLVESSRDTSDLKLTAHAGRELPNELRAVEAGHSVGTIMQGGRADVQLMRGGLNTTSTVKYAADIGLQAFKLFEFLFGKLPFKRVSVVGLPVSSPTRGYPNLVFVPFTTFLDATTQNRLGYHQTAELREFYKNTGIHAIAHQWWEHLVGGRTYHDQWIWAGGGDFALSMYLRQFEPQELNNYRDIRRKWLLSKNSSGYRPVDAGPVWLNDQLDEYNERNNSLHVIPYKGGYIMEMLRGQRSSRTGRCTGSVSRPSTSGPPILWGLPPSLAGYFATGRSPLSEPAPTRESTANPVSASASPRKWE